MKLFLIIFILFALTSSKCFKTASGNTSALAGQSRMCGSYTSPLCEETPHDPTRAISVTLSPESAVGLEVVAYAGKS